MKENYHPNQEQGLRRSSFCIFCG